MISSCNQCLDPELANHETPATSANARLTRVWRYGLLPPTVNAAGVAEQMRLAHTYQNRLIELERKRRNDRDTVLEQSTPAMVDVTAKIKATETELERERARISAERSKTKNKEAGNTDLARDAVAALKQLRKEYRIHLKEALEIATVKATLAVIEDGHKVAVREARGTCGVYWGTYLQIEGAVQQARASSTAPKFVRWTGDGAVSVQLQKGLSTESVINCTDQRVRLSLQPIPVPGRGGKPCPRLLLRIGSVGREPVFAEWPVTYHRPLPCDGAIKWAKVVRRRQASHDQWSLHLTVETNAPEMSNDDSAIAVNLRWKGVSVDGCATTLAADWCDDVSTGELSVETEVVGMIRKSEDLRSIRDKNFDQAKVHLILALKAAALPDAHKERLKALHLWRACGKLAVYAIWWRSNRYDNDGELLAIVEAWRKQDKHLWEWEFNSRRKALARRRDAYRVFAARMVVRHRTLVIEKLNIAKLAAIPKPEEDRESNPKERSQRFDTAPSELRSALIKVFKREGAKIVEVPAGLSSAEMLTHYRSTGGDEIGRPAVRSARFNRLRKLPQLPAV